MKTIPQRLSGGTGLTYVAHCGISDDAPYRAAAAFLDEKDRWRPYRSDAVQASPLGAYLALMRRILETVSAEAAKSYIFFYPADPSIAQRLRDAVAERAEDLGEPGTEADWQYLRDACCAERCGISVLIQKNGPGTGTLAVLRALDGETDSVAEASTGLNEDLPQPEPCEDNGPATGRTASHEDLFG